MRRNSKLQRQEKKKVALHEPIDSQVRSAHAEFYRAANIHRSKRSEGIIPVSKALWYRWVADGFAPQPIKVGRVSLWRACDVHAFADRLAGGEL